MIVAEVKVDDESPFRVKLFNSSMKAFQRMTNKKYVAIGRVAEMDDDELIAAVVQQLGWN